MRFILNLVSAIAMCAALATACAAEPRSGADYLTLDDPVNTDSAGKVEVIEFFAYYCPHCNLFEPKLAAWVKQQGDKIAFKRVHVTRGPKVLPQQRLFYTLESMQLLEQYHHKVFEAMHTNDRLSLDTDEKVFAWAEQAGINRAKFISTYRSFGVQAKINRADVLMASYKVDHWPMMGFAGRWISSPTLAGQAVGARNEAELHDAALRMADLLIAKAKAEPK
jgi:thiol:disulfide interchange protein DsbA